MKKLSIITINYNNENGLRKTIESVVKQSNHDFEYIVIDGGSTDGSLNVIKEYDEYIDYWISEPDNGIYHAMNKGTLQARGEYCQFLNSGDYFYNNYVADFFINCNKREDIILGKTAHVDNKTGKIKIGRSVDNDISFLALYKGGINHQSSFIKRNYLLLYPYDEKYKICSDWKFFLQALIIGNCSFTTVDNIIIYFDMGGVSNTQIDNNIKEREVIINELFFFPPRIKYDYEIFDMSSYELSKKMSYYNGFAKFIYKLDLLLIKLYRLILKR